MLRQHISIQSIPAILWGNQSKRVYIFVHGKSSYKEEAGKFAEIAIRNGYQVLSFDLPEHGERTCENYPCNVWNGVSDLRKVWQYASKKWDRFSLYACSLGAYFSLLAYKDVRFDKVLFQSPILDMERLIKNMLNWFNITEEELRLKKEIQTPIGETLSWDYYSYVLKNPIDRWSSRTNIIYGTNDSLTERDVVDGFAKRFHCSLEIVDGGQHYFQSDSETKALNDWMISLV